MEKPEYQQTTLLSELANGSIEMGEAIALAFDDMVLQSGIQNPNAQNIEITEKSWLKLAAKENKSKEDIKKLDEELFETIDYLAQSYLLFIAKETKNLTGRIDYHQYESYMLKYRFGKYNIMNKAEYTNEVKAKLRVAFNKIANHGEPTNDNLIDKKDMAAYLYAMAMRSTHDKDNKFVGFELNGIITPQECAVSEALLFENKDNLFSVKLRIAYKVLNK